jgi:hypothetical protein
MFEVTRKLRTKITATSPRGFAAHRLGPTGAEEKQRYILHDTNKTQRLADFLSLPVNLNMSTHFYKHFLFLHLRTLNFSHSSKSFNIANWIAGFNSLQGHELLIALTKPWSAPVPTQSPIKEVQGVFSPKIKQAAVKLVTHIPPVPELRMSRATQTSPPPQYSFMACPGTISTASFNVVY